MVASLTAVAMLGACTPRHKQVATYGAIGVALVGVGVYFHGALRACEATPGSDRSDVCEEGRHDEKNTGGVIAIAGVVAVILAQLWPVAEPARDEVVQPEPRREVVVAPPLIETSPADATRLRDPAAVQLAENARKFAGAGKCIEAFGSLTALRRIDPALADQLQAWDPVVSRCRKASEAGPTATPAPTPPGPPGETATTATP